MPLSLSDSDKAAGRRCAPDASIKRGMPAARRIMLATAIAASLLLTGCVVAPIDPGPPHCPPGQAKKGNCAPHHGGGFCPPGQAKKGNCW